MTKGYRENRRSDGEEREGMQGRVNTGERG